MGKTIWQRATASIVQLLWNNWILASHSRLNGNGQRSTLSEHVVQNNEAIEMRSQQWCLQKAKLIGQNCWVLVNNLLVSDAIRNLRMAQGILGLAGKFGDGLLEFACSEALKRRMLNYGEIKRFCQRYYTDNLAGGN